MTSRRTSLFISHANPEDNAFTIWLGGRLGALGYDVWADVLKLVGGFDWQRRLEDALRNKTGKLLLVGTPDAISKRLVRNEVQIAYKVSKTLKDDEFIIPLRLKEFDASLLIAHAQYINFENRWSEGLSELIEALEKNYKFPRGSSPSAETLGYWRQVQLVHAKRVIEKQETLYSNWLSLTDLPPKIFVYDFKPGVNIGRKERAVDNFKFPIAVHGRGFIGFGTSRV